MAPKGRFAPTPSGRMHLGNLLSALLAWLDARSGGGALVLRIEDLDTQRTSPDFVFALIGMIYGRTHTREITQMGGMMQIMPYLSVCYVIAGMASLGLPGLSGFVAEMTIFVGSFKAGMADFLSGAGSLRLVFTIIACCSIVITAVYILRVVGKLLFGP